MELSLPAWLGGIAGALVAVCLYIPAIRRLERHWRAQQGSMLPAQRTAFEEKLSVIRRVILGIDVAVLSSLGYWIGSVLGRASAVHPNF